MVKNKNILLVIRYNYVNMFTETTRILIHLDKTDGWSVDDACPDSYQSCRKEGPMVDFFIAPDLIFVILFLDL